MARSYPLPNSMPIRANLVESPATSPIQTPRVSGLTETAAFVPGRSNLNSTGGRLNLRTFVDLAMDANDAVLTLTLSGSGLSASL